MGDRYSPTKVSDSCWDAGLPKVDSVQLRERITTHPEVDGANNGQVLPDAVAFTGEGKLVRKATGYEQESRSLTIRHRVRRLRQPNFPAAFECISDPQIPLTRLIF